VLFAILFSFNDSRSLSVWHGFTLKWYTSTDPNIDSVFHSAELFGALEQSMKLAALDVLIAVPIGVFLALGLARWRGRGSGASNFLMLFPLVTPEILAGVSLLQPPPPFLAVRLRRRGAGSLPLLDRLRGRDGGGKFFLDGPAVRGGGARLGRCPRHTALSGAPAAPVAGDRCQRRNRVRDLDR